MKNIKIIFTVFAGWVFLSSCSKLIYSHKQVMASYHTKDDVARQFGQPDEVMIVSDTTKWLYNCSDTSIFVDSKTKVKISGVFNTEMGFNTTPVNVTRFSKYDKYVKFVFDNDGKVLSWNSSGLNFAERKPKTLATIGVVVGGVLFAIATIGAISFVNGFKNIGQ